MSIRVMVYGKVHRQEDIQAFEEAFSQVSRAVKGTAGHVHDELLHDCENPLLFILLSEWNSREEFLRWEESPIHREVTVPIRPYWKAERERKIFDIDVRIEH